MRKFSGLFYAVLNLSIALFLDKEFLLIIMNSFIAGVCFALFLIDSAGL